MSRSRAASITAGMCRAGMFSRLIQDITVDGGRLNARAIGLGPPNRWTIWRELSMDYSVRNGRTMSSAMCATRAQTPVRSLRILNPMPDKTLLAPGPAALNLRRLRKKAGIGFREMSRLCGIPFTKYRHYEVKLKGDSLPPDIYLIVKPVLLSHGITMDELRVLMHEVMREELRGVHEHLSQLERLIRGKPAAPPDSD